MIRWIGVLPAAFLGRVAVEFIAGIVVRIGRDVGWIIPQQSQFVFYLLILLFYPPKEAAFVIAGASVAPRRRFETAFVLAVAAILMSLLRHILGQTHTGVVNYAHFAAESAGAIAGAAYIYFASTKK